jgi:heme-degrading monooxygenase HmoA
MTSIVTHHLTPSGLEQFREWFQRLRAVLEQQKGFVSVRSFSDVSDPHARLVVLEMRTEEDLRAWTSGSDKARLLREIEGLATKPWTLLRLREVV